MSDKKQPWGRVYAVVPNPVFNPENESSKKFSYLELGVAWMNTNNDGRQSLKIVLDIEPVQWRDPNCPRVIDVQKIERQNGARR